MLSNGKTLATWKITVLPAEIPPGESIPAVRLTDHRPGYLTYEGPVSNQRGQVTIADSGEYDLLSEIPGRWEILLAGKNTKGRFELTRCQDNPNTWALKLLTD